MYSKKTWKIFKKINPLKISTDTFLASTRHDWPRWTDRTCFPCRWSWSGSSGSRYRRIPGGCTAERCMCRTTRNRRSTKKSSVRLATPYVRLREREEKVSESTKKTVSAIFRKNNHNAYKSSPGLRQFDSFAFLRFPGYWTFLYFASRTFETRSLFSGSCFADVRNTF